MAVALITPAGAQVANGAGPVLEVSAATARRVVREAVASGKFAGFVNACSGEWDASCLAEQVADALERYGASWAGTRAKHLRYDRCHLKMAAHYEGAMVAPYRRVSSASTASKISDGLQFPVAFRSLDANDASAVVCDTEAALATELAKFTNTHPTCVVEEWFGFPTSTVFIAGNGDECRILSGDASDELTTLTLKLFKSIFENVGFATFSFSKTADGKAVLVDLIGTPTSQHLASDAASALAGFVRAPPRPSFAVDFHPQMRGYHVRAAKALPKGSVVFEDEGHAFPLVTRAHVEKTWSQADREVFKRYAWPIDSEAHVYAIWENDPRTWRPINHSCDPNLVFGDGHSLNVVAARDIADGDDLTLDYTTFCDESMEPFECFCGATCCRKRIFPDEENLKRFGTNAWHRRLPRPATK